MQNKTINKIIAGAFLVIYTLFFLIYCIIEILKNSSQWQIYIFSFIYLLLGIIFLKLFYEKIILSEAHTN